MRKLLTAFLPMSLAGVALGVLAAGPAAGAEGSALSPLADATGLLLPAALGYLLGSIPFGLVLTRLAGLGDIRTIGSGNIGATNVLRTGRKGIAALTLLLDALKGTLAVIVGHALGAGAGLAIVGGLVAGFVAFLGHLFPVWLGFKGGKGVATYIGVVGGLIWIGAAIFCAAWLATAFVSRYSSLSALLASAATPVALLALGYTAEGAVAALMSVLLVWKHAGNIGRLRKGEEPRIGAKA